MPNAPFFSPFPHYYPGLRHHYPAYPELFHSRPYSPFPTQQCVWNVCSETFKRISYHISLLHFLWWQLNKIQTSPHCLPQPYGTFHWHLLTSSATASLLPPASSLTFLQSRNPSDPQTLHADSQIMAFELTGSFYQSNFTLIPCLYCRDLDALRDCHAEGSKSERKTNIVY